MEQFSDDRWQEGRNLKEEISKKVKSKRNKVESIQNGIDTYFLLGEGINIDVDDVDQPDEFYYH